MLAPDGVITFPLEGWVFLVHDKWFDVDFQFVRDPVLDCPCQRVKMIPGMVDHELVGLLQEVFLQLVHFLGDQIRGRVLLSG